MLTDDLPAERVRSLIAEGNARAALDLAKQTHERLRAPASEALFRDSYAARVEELIGRALWAEADGMLANMRKRWPAEEDRTREAAMRIAMGRGRPDALLVRLCDPSLGNDERVSLEATLRERLTDLGILADCAAVPADHPLRRDAQTLRAAFIAVTEGSVERGALDLPNISRRSPLAPWKLLTQAIVCYYRGEDEECRRFLQAIDAQSPPGKVVPALLAALQGVVPSEGGMHAKFVAGITCNRIAVRESLHALDAAFDRKKIPDILRAVSVALERCGRSSPQLAERLRAILTIRWINDGLGTEELSAALGRICRTDAFFWRIFALSIEQRDNVSACALWERFRLHAAHEGVLTQEVCAALSLHMADLLRSYSPDELMEIRVRPKRRLPPISMFYGEQPAAMRVLAKELDGVEADPLWWLSPEKLYVRAVTADPNSDAFAAWLSWARKQNIPDFAGTAAAAWHAAFPNDFPPLLVLATQAEERGALKKSLGFLEAAERLHPSHPELRRMRLRLSLSALKRHVKQGSDHLALADIEALAELPLLKGNEGPTFFAAVEWGWAVYHADHEIAREREEVVVRALRVSGARLFLEGVGGKLFGLKSARMDPLLPVVSPDEESLAIGVASACALGETFAVDVRLPAPWVKSLERQIAQSGVNLAPGFLEALGKQAYAQDLLPLAYVVAGAGLVCGGPAAARFLLLRARSLPFSLSRRWDCLAAAVVLARDARDVETVDAALELGPQGKSVSRERAEEILRTERGEKAYPSRTARGTYTREPSFPTLMEFIEKQGLS